MTPGQETPPVLWAPDPAAKTALGNFARYLEQRIGRTFGDYADLWEYSTTETAPFWGAVADFFDIQWHSAPVRVLTNAVMPGAQWFPGGSLNYAEHALRGAATVTPGEPAVIAATEDGSHQSLTAAELCQLVGAVQAGLRQLGVGPGDRVVALVPNTVHALATFLATAALGAVWSSCSPDFGAPSVIDRFTQISPTVLIAVDGYRYGGREFPVTATVEAVRRALPSLSGAVHIPALGTPPPDGMTGWDKFTDTPAEPNFTPVPFDAPLWVLYSSGTTGLPKPIVHSVGGILLEHLKSLRLQWDLGPGDRFLWFTTTGWMMWNFLIGGLLVGSTIVLYDGSPGYPDMTALWYVAARCKVTVFGTSAPFVAACQKAELRPNQRFELSGLRAIGSTGSPLSSDGFSWIHDQVSSSVPIISFSGGTDLCTGFVGGAPTVPVWSGEISCRALGAKVEAYSPEGEAIVGQVGELVITKPMPSMPIFFWGDTDNQRLNDSYFVDYPGVWRHGDWIRITTRGSSVIEGRSDATLNRGGVRMGTSEFYRVVESASEVADSMVIDTSTAQTDGDLVLFVVLTEEVDRELFTKQLKNIIRAQISPRHVPATVTYVPVIPRTINGKKCEVPIKRILAGADVDSVISKDSLADAASFDTFLRIALS